MRLRLLVCLLLVTLLSGQAPQPVPVTPPPAPPAGAATAPDTTPPPPSVGPNDTIITIKGFCPGTSLEGDACKTAVTKAQFEKLVDALQPGMPTPIRRQLANAYGSAITMSAAAEKRGLDKQPGFEESMNFARMQLLSQQLRRALQTETSNVSDQDIQDFYQKNTANYEQATFIRIFVPHTKRVAAPAPAKKGTAPTDAAKAAPAPAKKLSPEAEEKAGEAAMLKEAKLLRARLVKGEDADKLQKEAYVAGGVSGGSPATKLDKIRRTALPIAHQSVMDLKPGEFSDVISDASGNYIYKLVSKETVPLEGVKNEIKGQLSAQRYRDAMQPFQNNMDLNPAYFGAGRTPVMQPPPRGPQPPAKAKDKEEDEDRD